MEKQDKTKITGENADIICKKLRDNAESESVDILERARKEAETILSQARLEAHKNADIVLKLAEQEAGILCERINSAANLEKKRAFLQERGRLAGAVFAAVNDAAGSYRGNPEYRPFLKKIIIDAARLLEEDVLCVLFSPEDGILLDQEFRVQTQSACCAAAARNIVLSFLPGEFREIGVIVRTESGSRIFDGRFSSLLQQRYDEFYGRIMKEMF